MIWREVWEAYPACDYKGSGLVSGLWGSEEWIQAPGMRRLYRMDGGDSSVPL